MDQLVELVPPKEITLAEHAAVIRALGKRVVGDVIEIGRRLAAAKELCNHGGWLPWLEREFGWKETTAWNFMKVYELSLKSSNFEDLNLPVSGLYLLAAPSTPDEAVDAIIEKAEAGERLSVDDVKKMIADARRDEKSRLEAILAKARTAFDAEVEALRKELENALTASELKRVIAEAAAPLKAKIEKYEKRLQRLSEKAKGPKDEFGVQAATVSGALRRLADSLTISPDQMIEAQKIITRITAQPLKQGLADDLKHALQIEHWISHFIKSARKIK